MTLPTLFGPGRALVTAALAVLLAAGCGDHAVGGDVNDNGNSNANDNSNSGGCPDGIECYVDFPCNLVTACVLDSTSIIQNITHQCEEICGTPCCSGATCETWAPGCSAGTVCAYPDADPHTFALAIRWVDEQNTPSCVPLDEVCGGPEAFPCPAGYYCELVGALCPHPTDYLTENCVGAPGEYEPTDFCAYAAAGGYGTCRPLEDPGNCTLMEQDPVCSCDGTTYDNDCFRRAAGAPYGTAGPCSP